MKNIVIIGGGTGTSTLLKGLKNYPVNLSVVVSSWDDGGSNGRLIKELKAFPFSDIRQCLAALGEPGFWKDFFSYRFSQGELAGHTAANLFLAQMQKLTGSVTEPINIARQLLNVKAQIYPATLSAATLIAVLESGKKIVGEHLVDSPQKGKFSPIKFLSLSGGKANPAAAKAILNADVLVLGPGDLHTSILPNLLAPGIKLAVAKSQAKKVLVCNLMTKNGQTNGFRASDFVLEFLKYYPVLDFVILNSQTPKKEVLNKYRQHQSEMVEVDKERLKNLNINIILANLLSPEKVKKTKGDSLKRSFLRHDSKKLAKLITKLILI